MRRAIPHPGKRRKGHPDAAALRQVLAVTGMREVNRQEPDSPRHRLVDKLKNRQTLLFLGLCFIAALVDIEDVLLDGTFSRA